MKVDGIKAYAVRAPTQAYRWRDGAPTPDEGNATSEFLLLQILTDQGLVGECLWPHGKVLAESSRASLIFEYLERIIQPAFRGIDPLRRECIWQRLWDTDRYAQMPPYIIGILDVALWDLLGKKADVPLWKLLGGYRDRIMAYASTFTLTNIDDYRVHARELINRGYRAIKLHVWGQVKEDIRACQAVREEVGKDIILMLDSAGAYSREEALWAGRELERLGYYWYEEPIKDHDLEGLRTLAQALDIPLLVAESTWGGPFAIANVLRARAADMIHADWYLKGGISGLLKIAYLCEANGIKCQVHAGGIENLHVACAIRNTDFHEQMVPEETFHLLVKNPIVKPDEEGYVSPPDSPGIGLELDWESIKQHTYETLD